MVAHARNPLTFRETDEADNLTATYVYSKQNTPSARKRDALTGRVDVMDPSSTLWTWSPKPLIRSLSDVFLPSGYPQSVSEDYIRYQIFDSLQAFCSSIAGLLSSRAVLQGVGVGDANASPSSALLLHVLQDSSGRVATILFAHRVGTALEPECKTYRLAADVFNDIAMIMDTLSPMVPAGVMRVGILSTAGILRALCGVAGGSSKASLSAHFAKWGNLAELNAKDSSQETIISLFGMLVGSVVVSRVTGFKTTWAALLILLAAHLSLNYAAVRAVQMTSLNRQRANIIFSTLLESDPAIDIERLRSGEVPKSKAKPDTSSWKILTPAQVSREERIFHRDGALQWNTPSQTRNLGSASIGVSLASFFKQAQASQHTSRGSLQTNIPMPDLTTLFANESYILYLHPNGTEWHASILLKSNCTVHSQLKAWTHGLLAARVLSTTTSKSGTEPTPEVLSVVTNTLSLLNSQFSSYTDALEEAGWNTTIAALETRSGRRVTFT
ncbi:uncharacterized protein N7498_008521 [Penicillium cinerascens]|uniref:DUF647 domain-containing protein n=1 Tax=Penicillium cinerascens TaxID=70096 RepID=A0A9W9MAR6_9EURO|nr:uncharacterized protein N7498_008521 [Penicillium cinerascens]KAJ5195083.1 hypothetical protein N7498_008521 [Penicillium cinerascens]